MDKTADFVARNGIKFEERIRENEKSNPKFSFLQPTDPYHAYYQHRIKEIQEGKGTSPRRCQTARYAAAYACPGALCVCRAGTAASGGPQG